MTLKKPLKKPFFILFGLVIFIVGLLIYSNRKKHFLQNQLPALVNKKTNSLYNISYDSISVDEIGGNVYIKNIHVKGDTTAQLQMISRHDTNATSVMFEVFIPMLKVVGFKTAKVLLSKQLECSQIVILNPIATVYLFPGVSTPADEKKKKEALYKQLLGNFTLIKADSVAIINSQVTAEDFFTKEVKFKTGGTTIDLNQLAIDSTYNQDTSRTLFCKAITINSNTISLGKKENNAEILRAAFSTRSKILTLSSLNYDGFKNDGFFKSSLSNISLEGIKWSGPVENSELVIDKVIIEKGNVESLVSGKSDGKTTDTKILTGWLKSFSLNSLLLKSLSFTAKTSEPGSKPLIIKNNSFSIKHVFIDRLAKMDESLFKQAKEIEFYNDAININSADNMYNYKISGIKLNTKTKELGIKSIKVIPYLNEAAFAKKARHRKDRYDVDLEKIKCTNVDVGNLIKGKINIDRVQTTGSSVKIFTDLSYPSDTTSKHGRQQSYPLQIIHKMGFPVKINSFICNNTYIEYKEKNATSKNSGRVRFSGSNLVAHNISTYRAKAGELMTIDFRTMFLDKIPVNGQFTFLLNEWEKGTFTAKALISQSFDATVLNELTQPMSMLRIDKGVIKSVNFTVSGDTSTARANFKLPYEDFKIAFLKMNNGSYAKKGIFSLITNLIVRNNNKEGKNERTAKVAFDENKYRLFFAFIWATMFKGIKDICIVKL